jgi:hypothetical protein
VHIQGSRDIGRGWSGRDCGVEAVELDGGWGREEGEEEEGMEEQEEEREDEGSSSLSCPGCHLLPVCVFCVC